MDITVRFEIMSVGNRAVRRRSCLCKVYFCLRMASKADDDLDRRMVRFGRFIFSPARCYVIGRHIHLNPLTNFCLPDKFSFLAVVQI